MPTHNFWIGMSGDFQSDLVGWLAPLNLETGERPDQIDPPNFPALKFMSQATIDFFNQSHDSGTLDHLFRRHSASSRNYRVWSFYVQKPENVSEVKDDLDSMRNTYPQDFLIMGAWLFQTGEPIGGEDDPTFPNPPTLINFMPLIWEDDGEGGYNSREPTELTNVNLLVGQAPRVFA